jgi:imidazolonepropionase-like amidohydrolase
MKAKLYLSCIALFLTKAVFCQIFIKNVTVVDVEKGKLIPAQTVAINGNLISDIGPAKKVRIPASVTVIDGSGKFLMPGLIDAHVHFFQSGGLYTRPDGLDLRKYVPYDQEIAWGHAHMDEFLRRYVKLGITTVVDPGATFNFLKERDSLRNKAYAPNIYMAGPLITTFEPQVFQKLGNDEPFNLISTPEEARTYIKKQLPYHPDFIKIWYIVQGKNVEEAARKLQPGVKAAIDEAHKNNLRVAVHATERITAQLAVESGCDYLVHEVEDEVVSDDFIKLLKQHHIVLCPTLIVADDFINTYAQKTNPSYYEFTQSNPQQLGSLYDLKHLPDTALTNRYKKRLNSITGRFAHEDSVRMINLKKMVDAGVAVAAGTDAGNPGTMHASSLFRELENMQQSGLSNWQIIRSATMGGAIAAGKGSELGSITKGKKADLILLNANPVDSIGNLKKIDMVINKGYVISPDTLIKETPEALVQRQVNAYNARNIEAFLEPYADDVEAYDYPDKLLGKGKDAMRKVYANMFAKVPELHCEIKGRVIQGNVVVDHESVSGFGKNKLEGMAIYHIENNKIKKVYFITQ